jgi:hypothetical protein
MYTVTTTTHPEGDLKEFLNQWDAYEYASELVEGGHSPVIRKGDAEFDWPRFHALVQGWDC